MFNDLLVFLEFHSKWFFAILVYQNFLLFIILFFYGKWIRSRPKLILSQFFLISGVIFLAFLFQHTGKIKLAGRLNFLLPGGFLLLMPFVYFYIRALANSKFKRWIYGLLHFIPAVTLLLVNIVYAFKNQSATLSLMNTPDDSLLLLFVLQGLLWGQFAYYTYQVVRFLRNDNVLSFNNFSAGRFKQQKWHFAFFAAFGMFSAIMAIMVFDSMLHQKQTNDILPYILAFITITLLIGLFSIKQKESTGDSSVLFTFLEEQNKDSSVTTGNQIISKPCNGQTDKKAKSQLTCEKREELMLLFQKLMKEDLYKDTQLNLGSLAKKMNSNSKYVSEAIHISTGMPFSKYITELRINEAKKLLSGNNTELYSIEGIGKMVGFQSKSTFNTHFKQLTGMTPSEYLQSLNR